MSLFARAAVARSAMRSLAATRVAQVAIRVVAAPLRSRSLLSKRFSSTGPSLARSDTFPKRHLGSNEAEQQEMLRALGYNSMSELIDAVVPKGIRLGRSLNIRQVPSESEYLAELRKVASQNKVFKSFIGQGYHNTIVPNVILRNVIENPAWYTPYTPYQAEIAQGRLQSLLNYQTMVADLTGMPVSNASLLDEATAAAEAMAVAFNAHRGKRTKFFVADGVHPQSLALIRTRAEPFGIEVVTGSPDALDYSAGDVCGALLQYPGTDGLVDPHIERHIAACKDAGAYCVVASDPLALTVLRPPGELGADMCVGTTQRFGVPLGFGGPHAGFFACADKLKRSIPGRIIGVSRDAQGRPALRMALQAREQHIRRDKATSNICTAQALLANVSAFYAMYHGPHGLRDIAERVHGLSTMFADGARALGLTVPHETFFDTVRVQVSAAAAVAVAAEAREMNVRVLASDAICVSMDETTAAADVAALLEVLAETHGAAAAPPLGAPRAAHDTFGALARESEFLTHPVFNSYQTETDMMRYMYELQTRDYGLANGMIPLGSCTMKLNAATEMIPVTWPEFNSIHPFAPASQTQGYTRMIRELESDLCEITGFDAVSLQPNSGANGEYAGLMAIRAYHKSRGDTRRNVCLIPLSAHGTNPASAAMAGMKVAPVKCDDDGNVDLDDLRARAAEHKDALAALMITYPSTHGVFEETIQSVCDIVHENGGQVYLDGANMNAQVGLCRPGDFGADVCHLNLHKTFCIPHGGGGPGVGPIGVKSQLAPFLPSHPVVPCGTDETTAIGPVAAAPFGSASILPISYGYIRMMGADGLRAASELAILNANYMAKRLHGYFDVMFTGTTGHVAHEFILDLSPFKKLADVTEFDIAKRLQDYGFHAPTMSWPVRSTVMAEPTESESKAELDRFCDALIAIRGEIDAIARGDLDREDNPLRNAPHTLEDVTATEWTHAYPRELAAFPIPSLRARKHWPTVGRLDDVFGDRNVVCTCPPMESYGEGFEARDAATM